MDTSVKGLKQSYGLMVNYYYDVDQIEANVEAFDSNGTVAANSRVKRLADLGARVLAGKPVASFAESWRRHCAFNAAIPPARSPRR